MATGNFSTSEWKQMVNAPQIIYHLLTKKDRAGIFTKRSEAKALDEYVSSHKPQSELVQSIIDGQKEADDKIDASPEEAARMLGQVGRLLEAKASDVEGDAAREFLMGAAEAIAKAVREESVLRDKPISEAEKETLAEIERALKATDADKRRRSDAAKAAEEKFKAERREEARKQVEELREQREAEAAAATKAREEREAEARKRVEAAREKREAEAAAAAKARERAEEARKRAAEAKKAAEEKARAEAEAMKAEAEQLKREAAKREAEAAAAAAAAPKAAPKSAEKIYVVKKGDTLSGIAQEVYGNAGRWREIFEANRDVIDKPNLIRPGWKLKIPK